MVGKIAPRTIAREDGRKRPDGRTRNGFGTRFCLRAASLLVARIERAAIGPMVEAMAGMHVPIAGLEVRRINVVDAYIRQKHRRRPPFEIAGISDHPQTGIHWTMVHHV